MATTSGKDAEWGFDYIILHETGHEWWGNHVTVSDNADLWVQEGFCTYSEALYVEYYQGYEAALRYLTAQKTNIQNRRPYPGPQRHQLRPDPQHRHLLQSRLDASYPAQYRE
jgi:aminopeptidase N